MTSPFTEPARPRPGTVLVRQALGADLMLLAERARRTGDPYLQTITDLARDHDSTAAGLSRRITGLQHTLTDLTAELATTTPLEDPAHLAGEATRIACLAAEAACQRLLLDELLRRPPYPTEPGLPVAAPLPLRPVRAGTGCGCACTSGGFCGGCGHAGCGRR